MVGCSSSDDADSGQSQQMSSLEVKVCVPTTGAPDYSPATRSTRNDGLQLRVVAEVYKRGDSKCLRHVSTLLTETSEANAYTFTIDSIATGDYDVYAWIDHTADGSDLFFDTATLSNVTCLQDATKATADQRQAYYGHTMAMVFHGTPSPRPEPPIIYAKMAFAHYRLMADDADMYERLRSANGWPQIEDLQVRITYTSYVPTAFNVLTGQPVDAAMGRTMTTNISIDSQGNIMLVDDYVFVTGMESEITVDIEIINPTTQEVIANSRGMTISYSQGYMSTISGHFLTNDTPLDGSVVITTRWDGEYDIEF